MQQGPPLPPFVMETALQKVQIAEDSWSIKDPERVSLAYTVDTKWRSQTDFINGREKVKGFLKRNGNRSCSEMNIYLARFKN